MKWVFTLVVFVFSLVVPVVNSYGQMGHYAIGEVTFRILSQESRNNIIDCGYIEQFNGSMGKASIWADIVKRNPRFFWTKPFHYYDIDNDPPEYCARMQFPSDPKEVNLINGVQRALNNLTTQTCGSFFYFNMLIHMLQDMHQPLHLTGKARGGNEVWFVYEGKRYNLHTFWDSIGLDMLMTDILHKPYTKDDVVDYFHYKFNSIHGKNMFCPQATNVSEMMKNILNVAEYSLQKNCEVVWRTEDGDYMTKSKELLHQLIIKSIETSYCVVTFATKNVNYKSEVDRN